MMIMDNGFSGRNVNRDVFQKTMKLIRQGIAARFKVSPNRDGSGISFYGK